MGRKITGSSKAKIDDLERAEQLFWKHVDKTETCWHWTGSKRNKGYGAFVWYENGKQIQGRAHRFSYLIHVSDIPDGLMVLHNCDTPSCVNPYHLFLGTNQDNVTDMVKKGRHRKACSITPKSEAKYQRGAQNHRAKLNDQKVINMHRLYAQGWTITELSRIFRVSGGNVHQILHFQKWSHVRELISGS